MSKRVRIPDAFECKRRPLSFKLTAPVTLTCLKKAQSRAGTTSTDKPNMHKAPPPGYKKSRLYSGEGPRTPRTSLLTTSWTGVTDTTSVALAKSSS